MNSSMDGLVAYLVESTTRERMAPRERMERVVWDAGRGEETVQMMYDTPQPEPRPRLTAHNVRIDVRQGDAWVSLPREAVAPVSACPGIRDVSVSVVVPYEKVVLSDEEAHVSLLEILCQCSTAEIAAVQSELRAGRLNGRSHNRCLFGIIARERGKEYHSLWMRSRFPMPPIEHWLISWAPDPNGSLACTPQTSTYAATFDGWLTAYLEVRGDADVMIEEPHALDEPYRYIGSGLVDALATCARETTAAVEGFARVLRSTQNGAMQRLHDDRDVTIHYRTSRRDLYADEEAHVSLLALLDHCHPHEVLAVRTALRSGSFDGRSPQRCLFGLIAACRGTDYPRLTEQLGVCMPPIECWVGAIRMGHVPHTNEHARLLDEWLTEWLEARTLRLDREPPALRTEQPYTWDEDRRRLIWIEAEVVQ